MITSHSATTQTRFGGFFYVRKHYEVVLYFDGPLSKWKRSRANWFFEDHPGGLRIPLFDPRHPMPEPDEREVIARRTFRYQWLAHAWAVGMLRGLNNCYGEVRRI